MKSKILLFISVALFMFILIGTGIFVYALGSSPAVDTPQTMVLFMKFNNDSSVGESYNDSTGDVIYDYSTAMNNGTNQGNVTWNSTGGYLGDGAFEFDGLTNKKIDISSVGNLNINDSDYTFAFWLKNTADSSYILGEESYNDYLLMDRYGRLVIEDSIDTTFDIDYGTLGVNSWVYVSIVFDSSEDNIFVYRNGELQGNYTNNLISHFTTKYIGVNKPDQNFTGSIDEFIIYNESLTATEVKYLYNDYTQECDSRLNINECRLRESITLNGGTYYLNGSTSSSGAMIIDGSNIVLDGNGSTVIGNYSSWGIYQFTAGYTNVTIKNLTIRNVYGGVIIKNGVNSSVHDLDIQNFTAVGIKYDGMNNSVIYSNNIIGNDSSIYGVTLNNFNYDNSIENNTINNVQYGIFINPDGKRIENTKIYNNTLYNQTDSGTGAISTRAGADNTTIDNNRIYNTYWNGLDIDSANNTIKNNYLYNISHNAIDLYDGVTPKTTSLSNYNVITDNDIINCTGGGVLIVSGHLNNFSNNYLNCPDSEYYAINNYGNKSNNYGNTYFNNTIVDWKNGYNVGGTNHTFLSNNLTGFSLYLDLYLLYSDEVDNSVFDDYLFNETIIIKLSNYGVNSTFYFRNPFDYIFINGSGGTAFSNLHFFNQTNALIYNTNGSIYGNSDISLNDGNINITLPPNNASCVFNEANLTEGVTRGSGRCVFPIWYLSSSTNASKYIKNNLTDKINSTVQFYVDNCSISKISFISATGAYIIANYSSWNCTTGSASIVTLTVPYLESSDGLEPDLNVSLGSGIYALEFRSRHAYDKDVWATNQTLTKGAFNITNNGTALVRTIGIRFNQTQAGWAIECNNATTGSWINLSTSYQTIYSDLAAGSSFQTWCRADLYNPSTIFRGKILFNITS